MHTPELFVFLLVNKGLITARYKSAAQKVTPEVSPDVKHRTQESSTRRCLSELWGWLSIAEVMTEFKSLGWRQQIINHGFDNDGLI